MTDGRRRSGGQEDKQSRAEKARSSPEVGRFYPASQLRNKEALLPTSEEEGEP